MDLKWSCRLRFQSLENALGFECKTCILTLRKWNIFLCDISHYVIDWQKMFLPKLVRILKWNNPWKEKAGNVLKTRLIYLGNLQKLVSTWHWVKDLKSRKKSGQNIIPLENWQKSCLSEQIDEPDKTYRFSKKHAVVFSFLFGTLDQPVFGPVDALGAKNDSQITRKCLKISHLTRVL